MEVCYQRRLTMLLIKSLTDRANIVDREALKDLIEEAERVGIPHEELEKGYLEITYRFVPKERVRIDARDGYRGGEITSEMAPNSPPPGGSK